MATYPSLVLAQQLAEVVKARLGLAVTVGQDTNGEPTLVIGAGTAGTESAFVRITKRDAAWGFDIVGHAQPQYGRPHKAQIVVEGINAIADAVEHSAYGQNPAGSKLTAILFAELARVGVKIELYKSAYGVAPAVAGITGTPVAEWDDLYYPIAAGQ